MKSKNLGYKIAYSIRNYYKDHKYMVYIPVGVVFGIILGIVFGIKNQYAITNFIDSALNDENIFGAVFVREFTLIILLDVTLLFTLLNRYFHILSASSLIMIGYKYGYTLVGLVLGNVAHGVISIILINIPFIIISTILMMIYYSYISSNLNLYCLRRRGRLYNVLFVELIFTLSFALHICFFHIIIPKCYILIFF